LDLLQQQAVESLEHQRAVQGRIADERRTIEDLRDEADRDLAELITERTRLHHQRAEFEAERAELTSARLDVQHQRTLAENDRLQAERLLAELEQLQTATASDREQTLSERSELEQRWSLLAQKEQHLTAWESELEQSAHQAREAQLERFERERLLQSRAAEIGALEAALLERESACLARQAQLDEQTQRLDEQRTAIELERTHEPLGRENRDPCESQPQDPPQQELFWQQRAAELETQLQVVRAELESALSRPADTARQPDTTDPSLPEFEAALHALAVELDSRQTDLSARQRDLDHQAEHLDAARREIAEARDREGDRNRIVREELEARQSELDQIATQLEQERAALAQERARVDQSAADVLERHQEIEQLVVGASASRRELDDQGASLQQREDTLAALIAATEERAAELAHLEAQLQSREHELAQRLAEVVPAATSSETTSEPDLSGPTTDVSQQQRSLDAERWAISLESERLTRQQAELEAACAELHAEEERLHRLAAAIEADRTAIREERAQLEQYWTEIHQAAEAHVHAPLDHERSPSWDEPSPTVAAGLFDTWSRTVELTEDGAEDRPEEYGSDPLDGPSEARFDDPGQATPEPVGHDVPADELSDNVPAEDVPDEALALRKQLAELFGMSTGELADRARRHQADDENRPGGDDNDPREHHSSAPAPVSPPAMPSVTRSVPAAQGAPPARATATSDHSARSEHGHRGSDHGAHESEDDYVTKYMEQLLARNRRTATEEPAPRPAPRPAPVEPVMPAEIRSAAATGAAPSLETVEAEAAALSKRPAARPDKGQERAHIESFRELANRSARSAVAKHNSSSLRNKFLVQMIVTGVSLVVTLVLLTAPLWGGVLYFSYGVVALLAATFSGWEMAKTASVLQTNLALQAGTYSGDLPDAGQMSLPQLVSQLLSRSRVADSERDPLLGEAPAGPPDSWGPSPAAVPQPHVESLAGRTEEAVRLEETAPESPHEATHSAAIPEIDPVAALLAESARFHSTMSEPSGLSERELAATAQGV
jgi:hypothetical protein